MKPDQFKKHHTPVDGGSPGQRFRLDAGLLTALYLLECCIGLVVLLWYRASSKGDWTSFLASRPGIVWTLAVAGAVGCGWMIGRRRWGPRRLAPREFWPAVIFNVFVVGSVLGIAEVGIRLAVTQWANGQMIGASHLRPRSWALLREQFARELTEPASHERYLVSDELLGWTVGPSRRGDIFEGEQLAYVSSREGLRSPTQGMTYDRDGGGCRIALVGDSFVHGDDVAFNDTWGVQLEKLLGNRCEVLNFGVSGYGVDQAFLRYQRDVRPWRPTAVLFGFISDDLNRMMNTYGFLHLRRMRLPAPKPRFVMADGRLELLNLPLPTNEMIIAAKRIQDLPFVEYDWDFAPSEWTEDWLDVSYLFRWYKTAYPLWDRRHPSLSYEAMESIATVIFKSFAEQAEADGSYPLVVWFPSAYSSVNEIEESEPGWSVGTEPSREPLAPRLLRKAHVPWTSPLSCLKQVPVQERLTKGSHYTSIGNAAVAACLREALEPHLKQAAGPTTKS